MSSAHQSRVACIWLKSNPLWNSTKDPIAGFGFSLLTRVIKATSQIFNVETRIYEESGYLIFDILVISGTTRQTFSGVLLFPFTWPGRLLPLGERREKSMCSWESRRTMQLGMLTTSFRLKALAWWINLSDTTWTPGSEVVTRRTHPRAKKASSCNHQVHKCAPSDAGEQSTQTIAVNRLIHCQQFSGRLEVCYAICTLQWVQALGPSVSFSIWSRGTVHVLLLMHGTSSIVFLVVLL